MIRINDILDEIIEYYPDADLGIIDRAYIFSARVHAGQVRLSGEPYLSHPLEVAHILARMKLDQVSVAAALLHDVVEDTHASQEEIEAMFGPEVAHIVSGVTKISTMSFQSSKARQAESIRKMILAMADDIRVIMIKLADRLHNMRTLQYHHSAEKQVAIAQETLDIYTPIAARLGIYWVKQELEDIAFRYVVPEAYGKIKSLINRGREEREEYIRSIKAYIKHTMDSAGINCEVTGRFKQYYSIYQKMLSQDLEFEEIYDIIAFRIILKTVPQCYEALGHVHSLWKPIPKKFKDYIGMPKANMYQSLHTTVIGSLGERIEIQIRTAEMDRVAKSGIAAHWSYKEGKSVDEKTGAAFAWIQNLVENQEDFADPGEFLENVRIDLFPDDIYVFTPQGEIKSLPKGATPVDFAYRIHTEVGNQCTGAKVNGRMVPLQTVLVTGDTVQVMTTKGSRPSQDWLNFVKTVKAKSRIRQWIRVQEKGRSITLGKEMCDKAFRKYRLNFATLYKSSEMEMAAADFGFKAAEDLIANVGYGKITPLQVIRKFQPKPEEEETHEKEDRSLFDKLIGRVRKKKTGDGVVVKGIHDVLVRFGKCCQPVPGDAITGFITQGQGVTIHRRTCVNADKLNPDRRIEVAWDSDSRETYPVKIRVRSSDRFGLLADIAATISKHGANILSANTDTTTDKTVSSYFTIAVEDTIHLQRILASIKKIKHVQGVVRLND
jgi:guanosine-3',5'-bis(diphosphate) 3'-pyrophosphohydrolase